MVEKFKEFKEAFESKFTKIYEFDPESPKIPIPFGGEEIRNDNHPTYDSYGNEETQLSSIYYFKEFDILIEFYGERCSYSSKGWIGYREVQEMQKIITFFEPVKNQ